MLKSRPAREGEKKAAGGILDGRTYDEMPPRADNPVPSKKERLAMIDMIAMGRGRFDAG